ncbi:MAG: MAPEG family protein [Colwellia sp.]|nr:MAPEG family protein [Colwellia sp.]
MGILLVYPMFSMVLLTFIVACIAIKARIASVKDKTVSAKFFRLMDGQEVPEVITKTTRNFNNQFEIPTLFYVVCTLYVCLGINSIIALTFAWGFVVLRIAHSYIHLTYNHILHRMATFWLSFMCVMVLWVNLLLQKL